MAGEIDVAIVGHNAKLVFLGDHVVFRCTDYLSAVAFMRTPTPMRPERRVEVEDDELRSCDQGRRGDGV